MYLITPPISDAAAYAPLFEAIAASDVACVLLRIAASGDSAKEEILRALAPSCKTMALRASSKDDPQLARRVNADGVHIEGTGPALQAALRSLQPGHIVGAGGLQTRDEAMIAGEAGADYVMFGGPASVEPHAQHRRARELVVGNLQRSLRRLRAGSLFDRRSCSRRRRLHRAWRRNLRRSAWRRSGIARRRPPDRFHPGNDPMTLSSGGGRVRLCTGLVAAWLAVEAGLFLAHAEPAAQSVQQPAAPSLGTASSRRPETDTLPVPAWLGAPDLALAAYQRGYYLTAMQEAMKRIEADPGDGPAMTLVGELYAQGLGVRHDATEAARWYALAAAAGDRQAIFALASSPNSKAKACRKIVPERRRCSKRRRRKITQARFTTSVFSRIENNGVTADFPKAARLFRQAAELGNSDAAYALGLLYQKRQRRRKKR